MPANSILIEKLIGHCKKPTQQSFLACCQEILNNFKFDCVFLSHSPTPEELQTPLAFEGKEEVMDGCLYRLGVEERVAISKIPLKTYSDITGKPVFNKSGSLRIQKPSSGIFMVHYRNKQSYILLGCGHLESRTYDPNLLSDLSVVFKGWSQALGEAVDKFQTPGFREEAVPAPVVKAGSASSMGILPKVDLEMITQPFQPKMASTDDKHRRPVVLVDEVTRLFNKDYFEECLGIEVERAKRYSRTMSLVFLSVAPVPPAVSMDENHIATQIAEILYKSLRTVDIICRLDKHKYGIILPDTANNTYGIIAKRVFKFFKQVMGENPPIFLNISASTYPKHAGNHLLLFENAEKLLVQAQEVGPNKAVLPE